MWKVQLFELNYGTEEAAAVQDVLASGWISMGPRTTEFEAAFNQRLGLDAGCTAVSSGTAALHLALIAAGVGPGDEVLVPALTFIADANVVKLLGARPVLVDSTSFEDWNVSPTSLGRSITDRTKAVIVVHFAGYACDMLSIKSAIAASAPGRDIPVIEDVAHAPGAKSNLGPCGSVGKVGCFSFFTNKNLAVGEGGMVTTKDATVHERIRGLRSHGMTSFSFDRLKGRASSYDVTEPGLNYRIDELRAAIGLVQLDKLPAANERRRKLVRNYRSALHGISSISMPFPDHSLDDATPHILPILLKDQAQRDAVATSLRDSGVQSSIHYPAIQRFTGYQDVVLAATPIASGISSRELTLPLFPTMTENQLDYVCECVRSAVSKSK